MSKKTSLTAYLLIGIFMISACDQKTQPDEEQGINNNLVMATFYNYYATEYKALTYQAFNIAKERIIKISNPENCIVFIRIIFSV